MERGTKIEIATTVDVGKRVWLIYSFFLGALTPPASLVDDSSFDGFERTLKQI